MKKLKLCKLPIETQLFLNSIFNNKSVNPDAFVLLFNDFLSSKLTNLSEYHHKQFNNISTLMFDRKMKYSIGNYPKPLISSSDYDDVSKSVFNSIYSIYFPMKTGLVQKIKNKLHNEY